jgi:hypothetical protein
MTKHSTTNRQDVAEQTQTTAKWPQGFGATGPIRCRAGLILEHLEQERRRLTKDQARIDYALRRNEQAIKAAKQIGGE